MALGLWEPGLAVMGGTAVCQMHRVACIASKPAPTGRDGPGVVGAGLGRDGGHCGLPDAPCCLHREQARSRRKRWPWGCGSRAWPRWGHCGLPDAPCCLHREQARSHRKRWPWGCGSRAWPRWEHCGLPDAPCCLHRGQARSHRGNAGAVVGQMAQPRTTAGRFAWALITSPSSRMPGAISSWAMEPKPRRRQGRGRVSGSTQNALLGSNSTPLANPA